MIIQLRDGERIGLWNCLLFYGLPSSHWVSVDGFTEHDTVDSIPFSCFWNQNNIRILYRFLFFKWVCWPIIMWSHRLLLVALYWFIRRKEVNKLLVWFFKQWLCFSFWNSIIKWFTDGIFYRSETIWTFTSGMENTKKCRMMWYMRVPIIYFKNRWDDVMAIRFYRECFHSAHLCFWLWWLLEHLLRLGLSWFVGNLMCLRVFSLCCRDWWR